jgi:CheY-like chemotaxis protein
MGTPIHQLSERVVLVVDDNELVCHMTTRILTSAGIRALEAHDGRQALALLSELGPSVVGLVVSDVAMPEMTGEKLATIMAERWPNVPVLLISGQGHPGADYHGFFLAKPFQPETLIAVVSQVAPSFSTIL